MIALVDSRLTFLDALEFGVLPVLVGLLLLVGSLFDDEGGDKEAGDGPVDPVQSGVDVRRVDIGVSGHDDVLEELSISSEDLARRGEQWPRTPTDARRTHCVMATKMMLKILYWNQVSLRRIIGQR